MLRPPGPWQRSLYPSTRRPSVVNDIPVIPNVVIVTYTAFMHINVYLSLVIIEANNNRIPACRKPNKTATISLISNRIYLGRLRFIKKHL